MTWGANPEVEDRTEWDEDDAEYGAWFFRRGDVADLSKYFIYHPRRTLTMDFSQKQRLIVARTMKELLGEGYSVKGIQEAIDAFYVSGPSDVPALAFRNREVRGRFLEGLTRTADNAVMTFVVNGFVRSDMELPWDRSRDDELSVKFAIDPALAQLADEFPTVVAQILEQGIDDDSLLYDAVDWLYYVQGVGVRPATRLPLSNVPLALMRPSLYRSRYESVG